MHFSNEQYYKVSFQYIMKLFISLYVWIMYVLKVMIHTFNLKLKKYMKKYMNIFLINTQTA